MKMAILLIHELLLVEESLMPPSANTLTRSVPASSFLVSEVPTGRVDPLDQDAGGLDLADPSQHAFAFRAAR